MPRPALASADLSTCAFILCSLLINELFSSPGDEYLYIFNRFFRSPPCVPCFGLQFDGHRAPGSTVTVWLPLSMAWQLGRWSTFELLRVSLRSATLMTPSFSFCPLVELFSCLVAAPSRCPLPMPVSWPSPQLKTCWLISCRQWQATNVATTLMLMMTMMVPSNCRTEACRKGAAGKSYWRGLPKNIHRELGLILSLLLNY